MLKSCTCEIWFSRDIPETMEYAHREYVINHNVFGKEFDLSLMKGENATVLYITPNNNNGEYRFTISRYMRR